MPIDGKFNGEKYLEILREVMLPSVRAIYPKPEIIYVVEDNSPVHRAKIVKKWFEEQNDIIRIDWPAISPDLNIIENIWSLVAKEWDNNKKKQKKI